MRHWLVKSEPDEYSFDDLKRDRKTGWDGVRNYQARNLMRDEMKKGDLVLFYHSNADPPGVAGIAEVARESHPDPTQFDRKSPKHDPKATPEAPRWFQVELRYKKALKRFLPLEELREQKALSDMALLQKGQRLSVQPVTPSEFAAVLALGERKS